MGQCVSTVQPELQHQQHQQQQRAAAVAAPAAALSEQQLTPLKAVAAAGIATPTAALDADAESKGEDVDASREVLDYDDPATQTADVIAAPEHVRVRLPSALSIGPTKYGGHALYATRDFAPGDVVYDSSYRIVNDTKPAHTITIRVYQAAAAAAAEQAQVKVKGKKKGVAVGAELHAAHKRYQRKPPAAAPAPAPVAVPVKVTLPARAAAAPAPAPVRVAAPALAPVAEADAEKTESPALKPAPAPQNTPSRAGSLSISNSNSVSNSNANEKESERAEPEGISSSANANAVASGSSASAKAQAKAKVKEELKCVFEFELDLHTHAVRHRTGLRRMYSFDSMTNHSCRGHTFEYATPQQRAHGTFSVIACRPIKAGDEIHTDYALYEADCRDKGISACGCGTDQCRGSVAGFLYLTPEQQLALIASGQCVPDMYALVLDAAKRASALGLAPERAPDTAEALAARFAVTSKARELAPVRVDERVLTAIRKVVATMPERGISPL